MIPALRALVLAIWTLSGVRMTGDTEAIAEAIAQAVDADGEGPPVYSSHGEDAAVMAVFAMYESHLQVAPKPESWDARAGLSCGYLQIPCFVVRSHSLAGQGHYWLRLLHRGRDICPDSPAAPLSGGCRQARRLADLRSARARELLSLVLQSISNSRRSWPRSRTRAMASSRPPSVTPRPSSTSDAASTDCRGPHVRWRAGAHVGLLRTELRLVTTPVCGALSVAPAGGTPAQCDLEQGHTVQHGSHQDGRFYRWGRGSAKKRTRPLVAVTLSPEAIERVDEIARRTGSSRSGTIESLVRAATMPRAK